MSEMHPGDLDIAVIGMAGRFPRARNIEEYWKNLRDGVECISSFSEEDLLAAGVAATTLHDPAHVRAGGVLEGVELFDASFFGYSPGEAELLDPQQRLLLECAYHALENAGYDAERYQGLIGVYAGSSINNYFLRHVMAERETTLSATLGNHPGTLATRISYKMNLKGPGITLQTACSTSLVALHIACQDLLGYRTDIALAGGVAVNTEQRQGYFFADGLLSPDGHCRAFDAQGQGTVPGSGVGVVVLKRLEEAIADRDTIYAVIKGSAINNDGSQKVGFTAPSVSGQAAAIAAAQAIAEIEPDTITYLEAHGTATPLGDPIEMEALNAVFRARTSNTGFCALGSVKTNIGHLDAAAGIAGFIKTVLMLQYRQLVPSLHFTHPNPQIDFTHSPFYVNTALIPWNPERSPRRVGVSSFGMGGTNAHVILEEAPPQVPSSPARNWQLLLLSAKTPAALEEKTRQLREYIQLHPEINLADVACTLQVGRTAFAHRRMMVCRDRDDALHLLAGREPSRALTTMYEGREPVVAFLFPGQGTLSAQIAENLYQERSTFREELDQGAEFLRPLLGKDLRTLLFPRQSVSKEERDQLNQPYLAQPALFLIEYAMARFLMRAGVQPQAMLGHSLGEYVAACLAGVFSWQDALKILTFRGRLVQQTPPGAMLAAAISQEEACAFLPGERLSLAAINGQSQCVLAGEEEAITAVEHQLALQKKGYQRLSITRAMHSPMMDVILEPFRTYMQQIELKAPQIPYISGITGEWITAEETMNPDYWSQHLRRTVSFAQGLHILLNDPHRLLIEVGPGQTLSALARKQTRGQRTALALAQRDQQIDRAQVLATLGRLWLAGVPISWELSQDQENRHRIPLPAYPFERKSHWIAPPGKRPETDGTLPDRRNGDRHGFFIPSWKRSPLFQQGESLPRQTRWLVFSDAYAAELASSIVTRLRQNHKQVIVVDGGNGFVKIDEQTYRIHPERPGDYTALFQELISAGNFPEAIVHLWNVTAYASEQLTEALFEERQWKGFSSLLTLARIMSEHNSTWTPQITVLANSLCEVHGNERLQAEKALLFEACTKISQFYAPVICHIIDIPYPQEATENREKLVDQIMTEISAGNHDRISAYRGNHRWIPLCEAISLDRETDQSKAQLIKPGGVYLITAGLGKTGMAVATGLAQTAQAKFAFVDHLDLPEKKHRAQWLSADEIQKPSDRHLASESTSIEHGPSVDRDQEHTYIQALEEQIEQSLRAEGFSNQLEAEFDPLCTAYIVRYLASNGVEVRKGKMYDREELYKMLAILPKFRQFYLYLLHILEEDGIIKIAGKQLEFQKESVDALDLQQEMKKKFPAWNAALSLLEHCVNHYDRALTGAMEAISVLYPDDTPDEFRDAYDTAMRHTYAQVYLPLIPQILARLSPLPTRKLRILEIGGGDGFLTWQIIDALADLDVEYHFTDISKMFILKAQKQARQRNLHFMRFGVLDITKDPEAQGFNTSGYDVILSYNVLQATKDISKTLKMLKRLLASPGLLIHLETTLVQRMTMMIRGLAEGLWQTEDIRKDLLLPILEHRQWEELFQQEQFQSVHIYPQDEEKRKQADYALIVAHHQGQANAQDYMEQGTEKQQSERHPFTKIIQQLQMIEKTGSQVLTIRALMDDPAQVQKAISQIESQFGELNGVIHITESLVPGTIEPLSKEARSKALALFVLDKALREKRLDFALLVGQPSAVQEKSFATDLCLNTFTSPCNKARHIPWIGIQWESEQALAENNHSLIQQSALLDHSTGTASEVADILQAAVSLTGMTHIIAVLRDHQAEYTSKTTSHALREVEPLAQHTYVGPGNEREQTIASIWEEILGIDQISIHENFFELGGDSLLATQLLARLRKAFHVELSFQSFFETQTISGLAQIIEKGTEQHR